MHPCCKTFVILQLGNQTVSSANHAVAVAVMSLYVAIFPIHDNQVNRVFMRVWLLEIIDIVLRLVCTSLQPELDALSFCLFYISF